MCLSSQAARSAIGQDPGGDRQSACSTGLVVKQVEDILGYDDEALGDVLAVSADTSSWWLSDDVPAVSREAEAYSLCTLELSAV